MQESEPSYGYSVLARIMQDTPHRVVVTTNFDNLVADALSIFGKTYPLVCGHESLAGFISARVRRPLVVKVHRDLLLAPKSDPDDLKKLPEGFQAALAQLFGHYTPIVIGYGGNDGSLMGFLKALPPASVPGGVYWCYWEGGGPPPTDIRQFVAAQNGCLVPIPGFDEAMLLLGDALEFDVPDKFVVERAEKRAKRIVEQVQTLNARMEANKRGPATTSALEEISAKLPKELAAAPDVGGHWSGDAASITEPSDTNLLSNALKKTMRRTSGALRWWQWEEKAAAAANDDQRDRIYQKAISALPESHELLCNYAVFLKSVRKNYEQAEQYFLRALEADPEDADYLGNYALFLDEVGKEYDKAEEHYIRALAVDSVHANNLGNYGLFLEKVRKDEDKAEKYYLRAIAADPTNAHHLSSYATFLDAARKNYSEAKEYYLWSLAADPVDANTLGNYAKLLLANRCTEEGLAILDRAAALPEADMPSPLAVELQMYEVCHRLPEGWIAALSKLKSFLLTDKITTNDWDFSDVIETAKERKHPAGEWLEPLAAVLAGRSDESILDEWNAWKRA